LIAASARHHPLLLFKKPPGVAQRSVQHRSPFHPSSCSTPVTASWQLTARDRWRTVTPRLRNRSRTIDPSPVVTTLGSFHFQVSASPGPSHATAHHLSRSAQTTAPQRRPHRPPVLDTPHFTARHVADLRSSSNRTEREAALRYYQPCPDTGNSITSVATQGTSGPPCQVRIAQQLLSTLSGSLLTFSSLLCMLRMRLRSAPCCCCSAPKRR
jgi:hypothetical protein